MFGLILGVIVLGALYGALWGWCLVRVGDDDAMMPADARRRAAWKDDHR